MSDTSTAQREPFYLFQTVEEELAAGREFWLSRTTVERFHYVEHLRYLEYGEEAMNAPFVRCYGWRKRITDEYDPKNVVYF